MAGGSLGNLFCILLLNATLLQAQQTCAPLTEWHRGEGTFYGGVAGGWGNCALPVPLGDTMHAAMNHTDYDSSAICGACVRVVGPKGEVTLRIVDRCPECKPGDIDMTPQAFYKLAQAKDGRIKIAWQLITCPDTEICIKYKEGSSAYWTAIQIRNHAYPIAKLEYQNAQNVFVPIHRDMYNYFVQEQGIDAVKSPNAGPYVFRITSALGQSIVTPPVPFSTNSAVCIGQQFGLARCPDCWGDTLGLAKIDCCGECAGGNTGTEPNSGCKIDCNGYYDGLAYTDGCGRCVGGTTGLTPCDFDCAGVAGGGAYIDHCGNCVGGVTKLLPCTKQHIVLHKGLNLMSISLFPFDSSINVLFSKYKLLYIKNQTRFWRRDNPVALNSLSALSPNQGYMLWIDEPANVTLYGMGVDSSLALNYLFAPLVSSTGWQLRGYSLVPSASPIRLGNETKAAAIKNTEEIYLPTKTTNTLKQLENGKAYFIKVE